MRVLSLSLKNFRNHNELFISPSSYSNFFVGDNGAGKTAVLEALSLLFRRKSFRQGRAWIQKSFQESNISLTFENKDGKGEVQMLLSENRPSTYFFNGKKTNLLPLKQSGVFFTPEDLSAIRGSASYRRRLVDDLVLELPLGRKVLQGFQKILLQKNKFLKSCKKGEYSQRDRKTYLESINHVFFEKALILMKKRLQVLKEIEPFWKKRGEDFLKNRNFKAVYDLKDGALTKESEVASSLEREMKRGAFLEEIRGVCVAGPQSHDICFFWQDYEARESLSQGQQKALLLSWKLGQWDYNLNRNREAPCLFFDDVFSEIDQHFSKNLVEFLSNNPAQSFVTTTEAKGLFRDTTVFRLGERNKVNDEQTTEPSGIL
ncbi:MAG: DNA replication and repair protein RecF [Bdellovibrionales bacterium]|nr:DNA replication and repair protein RecF [Bdellovibrionales bacterium]